MKLLLLTCALCGLGISGARGDLTVIQSVEGLGQQTESTARFKDGKTRVDTSPETSLIMDLKSGEMINLLHGPKTYVKVSSATARAAIDSAKPAREDAGVAEARPALAATGRKDVISGLAAEEYTCAVGGAKMTLWLTRALPDYQAALREMSGALSEGPMGPLMQSYGLDMANLPGFPVRTVLEVAPGQTMTRTVKSVSTRTVPGAEFEIPPDYREIVVPVLTPPASEPAAASPAR